MRGDSDGARRYADHMSGTATLILDKVSVKRGGKLLISNLSLSLSGPNLLWIIGGNGIGKTSLLRSCAGLSQPETGQIFWTFGGTKIPAPQAISFLPSESYAKPGLKAAEDAAFWKADLATGEIETHRDTLTQNLSTGQTKRLSFAKLLADKKPIWILDEPLAGLDEAGRNLIAAHLQAHVRTGGLALVASHAPIAVRDISTQRLILE